MSSLEMTACRRVAVVEKEKMSDLKYVLKVDLAKVKRGRIHK